MTSLPVLRNMSESLAALCTTVWTFSASSSLSELMVMTSPEEQVNTELVDASSVR